MVNLRHLRALATIVDAGGFARAAERLHLSQPALSRQVAALEHDLGLRLFARLGRRAQLTSEGEDVLRRARRLLADADALGERARSLKDGDAGILRVGATPQAIETLVAGFLARYRKRHPRVEVELVEDGGARLPLRLERGDIHLANMPAGDARFEWRALAPVYVLAVFPADRRKPAGATVDVTELADMPLLLPRRDFGSRQWFDQACETARVRPRVLLESGAPHTLIALAQAGYGVAIVPGNARIETRGLRAAALVLRGVPLGGWASIAWDPRRFLAPYAAAFVDELAAYARRYYPRHPVTGRAPAIPKPVRAGRRR